MAEFVSTILVWTVAGAAFFALSGYLQQYTGEKWHVRESARKSVEEDTSERMKWRAALGGALGALGSCIYVAKCVIRKEDP